MDIEYAEYVAEQEALYWDRMMGEKVGTIEESTVYVLTFGSKPVGVYSTPELALENRNAFISTVDRHKDKTWIDIMFEVIPMQLDMPLDITKIKAN